MEKIYKIKRIVCIILVLSLTVALFSCKKDKADNEPSFDYADIGNMDFSFTERENNKGYDENGATLIDLLGSSASISGSGASVSENTVSITSAGTYIVSGELSGGVEIRADKSDKIQIVLNGASISNSAGAGILVASCEKLFVTLANDSENTVSDGESYELIEDGSAVDAAIFSKEDIAFNGEGRLTVTGNYKHGIVSKDDLVIAGGNISVTSKNVSLSANDAVKICNTNLTLNAGTDAIRAENDESAELGYVYIESGNISLTSENDAVQASSVIKIVGGSISAVTGGGSKNASTTSSGESNPSWGFGGGGRPGGGHGGPGGGFGGSSQNSSSTNAESAKGIKSTSDLIIEGGEFNIDSADDAIHSNANIKITAGEFSISSGDDGIHADSSLTIESGKFAISKSYEGIEATEIFICGGDIQITASDDGINAAGGTDASSMMGRPGQNGFSSSKGKIIISGGTVYMNASGDGIDANGSLEISGGNVTVCGPTSGDTSVLDFDNEGVITGGTFVGTGASMMAQTFTDSEQGVIALSVGNQYAGTKISLCDEKGNLIIEVEPKLSYQIVIISTPKMKSGETYKVTVGDISGEFEAN